MRLCELSGGYRDSEAALRARIARLRTEARAQSDREAARALELRADALTPLLRETRELAVLTARCYDRGYARYDRYTL